MWGRLLVVTFVPALTELALQWANRPRRRRKPVDQSEEVTLPVDTVSTPR